MKIPKNLKKFGHGTFNTLIKNKPAIWTFIGLTGFGFAYAGGIKATPKALMLIEKEKDRVNQVYAEESRRKGSDICQQIEDLTFFEKVKTCWKVFAPSTLTLIASACFVGAGFNGLHHRQVAAVAAYEISRDALNRYREAAREVLPDDLHEKLNTRIAEKSIDNVRDHDMIDILETGYGDTICYDSNFGRLFRCSASQIRRAESAINRTLVTEMFCSVNEFYAELGLSEVRLGNKLGWDVGKNQLRIEIEGGLTFGEEPCLLLQYDVTPIPTGWYD